MKHGIKLTITEQNKDLYVWDSELVTQNYKSFWTVANAIGLKRFTDCGKRYFLREQLELAQKCADLIKSAEVANTIQDAVFETKSA